MAIPSEYQDKATTIGCTNIKHPIYTFKVLMVRRRDESIGSLTNLKTADLLHPAMHDNSPDRGNTNKDFFETTFRPFLPGKLRGQNITRNDDGTFTAYGELAAYLKTEYADIDNPLLELQNSPPYTSA
jgi:hypothetical protein